MDKSIEKKIEIQKLAEQAHINSGLKSTICMSVGLGKGVLALGRIIKKCKENKKAKCLFFGDKTIYLTNFKMEFTKFKVGKYLDNVEMCCIDSLHKYEKNIYDIIIYDECHISTELGTEYLKKAIKLNPNVEIMCLTGTPKSSKRDGYKNNFDKLTDICPIAYTKMIDDSIEEGLINDYIINVIKVPFSEGKDTHVKTKGYDFWTSERKTYESLMNKYQKRKPGQGFPFELMNLKTFLKNSKTKVEYAKELAKRLEYKKLLIYAGSIKQTKLFPYKSYHSELDNKEKEQNYLDFYHGKIIELVNVNGIKESVSVPDLTHSIILSIDASDSSGQQILGRLCRLVPNKEIGNIYVILFEDSIEEVWFNKAFSNLDQSKINYI